MELAQDRVQWQALVLVVLNRSATRELVNSKMDIRKIGFKDGRWVELAQDRVQWPTLALAVSNRIGSGRKFTAYSSKKNNCPTKINAQQQIVLFFTERSGLLNTLSQKPFRCFSPSGQ
jgi:hypothetical protein